MIRLLIVAPSPALRAGLRALLTTDSFQLVGETSALAFAESPAADVIVAAQIDLAAEREWIEAQAEHSSLVLLSDEERAAEVLSAMPLSGWALLSSDVAADELRAAVLAVAESLVVLPSALYRQVFQKRVMHLSLDEHDMLSEPLTPREQEVLDLVAQGLPNKLIARRLNVSEHTVKFHLSAIFSKFGVTSRTEAIRRGSRLGLVTL